MESYYTTTRDLWNKCSYSVFYIILNWVPTDTHHLKLDISVKYSNLWGGACSSGGWMMLWLIEIVFSRCRIWFSAPAAEDWGIKSNNLVYLPFILYDFIISSRECKSQHVCSTGCLFEFVTSKVPSWCYTITTFLAFVTKLSFQSLDLYYMLEGETFCQRLFWASKTFSRQARKLQKIKSFYFSTNCSIFSPHKSIYFIPISATIHRALLSFRLSLFSSQTLSLFELSWRFHFR